MPVRNNAFANPYEREGFYKLHRAFGSGWRIYHNLPFLNVLEPNQGERQLLGLTNEEWDYLKKTSVDYIVCDNSDPHCRNSEIAVGLHPAKRQILVVLFPDDFTAKRLRRVPD